MKPSSLAFGLPIVCLKAPDGNEHINSRNGQLLRCSPHNELLAVRETPCISSIPHTSHLGLPRTPPSQENLARDSPPLISKGCRPARVPGLCRVNANRLKVQTADSCLSNSSVQGSTTITETRLYLPQSAVAVGSSNDPHLPSVTLGHHILYLGVSKAESDRFPRR